MSALDSATLAKLRDRGWLCNEYVEMHRTSTDLARELQCGPQTVIAWLRRHNIPVRRPGSEKFKVSLGDKFGRLTIVRLERLSGRRRCECICECGSTWRGLERNLVGGVTRSCGCLRREMLGVNRRTHGLSKHPDYELWLGVLSRCYCATRRTYKAYGARGIEVCERWRGADGFPNFLADMGARPGPGWDLHRIDNDGNYEPGNCEWLTRSAHSALHWDSDRRLKERIAELERENADLRARARA